MAVDKAIQATMLASALRRIVDLRVGEWRAALLSAAYFFCLLCAYYVIRPLREAMGIAGSVDDLPWLYLGTLGATLAVTPLFGWLVSHFPRRRFIPIAYHVLAANLLVFFALFRGEGIDGHIGVARGFYIWTSVFNLFAVAVFWSFMADLWTSEQGKRLFGFIAAGGTLGAIAGASMTEFMVQNIGPVNLLLVSAALLELATLCIFALTRAAPADSGAAERIGTPETPLNRTGAWGGVTMVLQSPYLLGIAGYMLLFTMSSTFVYFEQARIVAETFGADAAARTAAFAKVDRLVNTLTLMLQVLAVGRMMRHLGVAMMLMLLPLVTIGGFIALAMAPTFAVLAAFQVARRGMDYAVARPAREVLYTVLPRETKYKAKSFNDVFVYRGGDALAAWLSAGLKAAGLGFAAVLSTVVPLSILWLALGAALGWRQQIIGSRAREPDDARVSDTPAS
jgi:AAA family ATP:ADP antiporter